MPSTLIPKSPVIMDKIMPPPPKIAKLWVTRRLLSWKIVTFGNPTDKTH
jgi:hypothetical protein